MANDLLIVVDAGHGGWDNGASHNGRLEKDDNLRLALAVQRELLGQGLRVIMTRDSDEYISLQDRVKIANEANADLFVALHRNSYTHLTPSSNGVENFIYLTAPQQTSGRAAQLVLDAVVDVGVQSNRGVKRGNYYVLRRTKMPAMLLEMGYIINETDNQLFDQKLNEYAAAIAKGIMQYFGLEYRPSGTTPPPSTNSISEIQQEINRNFGTTMQITGAYDSQTRTAMTWVLQRTLNSDLNAGLVEDGIFGTRTRAAIPNVRRGQKGNVVYTIQALLALNGYDPGVLDGIYGSRTEQAAQAFQKDRGLNADGVAGPATVSALLGA